MIFINERELFEKIAPTLIVKGSIEACEGIFPRSEVEKVYEMLVSKTDDVNEYLSSICS